MSAEFVKKSAAMIPALIAAGKIKITHSSAFETAARGLWAELHRFATVGDLSQSHNWLADFADRIPTLGCSCREDWRKIITLIPADLSSRISFAKWTVKVHNVINRKLGKPVVDFAAAARIWDWPAGWIVQGGSDQGGK